MRLKNVINHLMLCAAICCTATVSAQAQDATDNSDLVGSLKPGNSHFMVAGLFTVGFMNQSTTNQLGGVKTTDKYNTLGDADRFEFSPMLIWRHGDKLLLEFEPSFDGTSLGVNWADVSYYLAPGFIVRAGYLVVPFGTYTKRLAAGWINKLPSDPMGADVGGTDFGVEVEGGFPLGSMKWSYDFSLTNGFQLNNDGTLDNVGIAAMNNGKTFCGRLALLPFSNSSLEIGVSGLWGALATPDGATFSNTNPTDTKGPSTNMYAVDVNYVKVFKPIQLNIKGQYNIKSVNNMNYLNPNDSGSYTFTNNESALFGQVSIRPVHSKNKVLKNMELAYRYVNYQSPKNSTWGQNYNENDISLDYWLSWRTVLKAGYENIKSDGTSSVAIEGTQGSTTINRLIIQFSTEF